MANVHSLDKKGLSVWVDTKLYLRFCLKAKQKGLKPFTAISEAMENFCFDIPLTDEIQQQAAKMRMVRAKRREEKRRTLKDAP